MWQKKPDTGWSQKPSCAVFPGAPPYFRLQGNEHDIFQADPTVTQHADGVRFTSTSCSHVAPLCPASPPCSRSPPPLFGLDYPDWHDGPHREWHMTQRGGLSSVAECRAVRTQRGVALVPEWRTSHPGRRTVLVPLETGDTGRLTEPDFPEPHLQWPEQSQSAAVGSKCSSTVTVVALWLQVCSYAKVLMRFGPNSLPLPSLPII